MNKIKRLFSCVCLLFFGLAASAGLQAHSTVVKLPKQAIKQTGNQFYLYTGKTLQSDASSNKVKLADHYSHMSHESHYSHSSHSSHFSG